jgi:hypothetical protein
MKLILYVNVSVRIASAKVLMVHLRALSPEFREYNSFIQEVWTKRADSRGVVEIPLEYFSPMLLRALTCLSSETCEAVVEAITRGDLVGAAVPGWIFVPSLAGLPLLPVIGHWVVSETTSSGSKRMDPLTHDSGIKFPDRVGERYHLNVQVTTIRDRRRNGSVLAVELLVVYPEHLDRAGRANQAQVMADILNRLKHQACMVTTIRDRRGNAWLKVAALLPLTAASLGNAPQIAADMLASLLWVGFDRKQVNVSVRFPAEDGFLKKDHARGRSAVEALAGPTLAQKFADPKTKKPGSCRLPQEALPAPTSERLKEFEEQVDAANQDEEEASAEVAAAPAPVQASSRTWLRSWADDSDSEELVPSAPTPKKKIRRGTRGGGRRC